MFGLSVNLSVNGKIPDGYKLVLHTKHPSGEQRRNLCDPVKGTVIFPQHDNEFTVKLERL